MTHAASRVFLASGGENRPGVQRGFTLIELLVVVAVLAIVMTALPLVFSRSRPGAQVKAAAFALSDQLRALRAAAILTHTNTVLELDLARARYSDLADGVTTDLPKDVETKFLGSQGEVHGTLVDVRFFPDGSSTGGRIGLFVGGTERWVTVQWLSGKVSVDE